MLFWLRLTFAYFCSYLHVLDVFRYFVSCQAALAFCKCCCRKVTKILQKLCKNPSKFIKLNRNDAQERSKSDPGSTSVPGTAPGRTRDNVLVAFWRYLGDLVCHFGVQLGVKGVPKIHFGTKSFKNQEN